MNKIYIIAGRNDQYRMFKRQLAEAMIEEGIEFRYQDIIYISDPTALRGHRDPWGYRVGTWNERRDINDIEMMIVTCGSTLNDFIEVAL